MPKLRPKGGHKFAPSRLTLGAAMLALLACTPAREEPATWTALQWRAAEGDTSVDLRDAVNALSDTAISSTARFRIGRNTFLVARLRTGSGTGWRQTEFRVIESGRTVWRLLADESVAASAHAPPGPYVIHGCLAIRDDTLLAYYAASDGAVGRRVVRDDSTARFGYYRWESSQNAFRFALPADSSLQGRCEVELRSLSQS